MVRTSQAQPSNLDAGALDDLDLDDMFADDGDMLFEGLDIQLEGMGDLISTDKKETSKKSKEEDEQGDESPKRRKTKRKTKAPVAYGDDDEDYFDESHPKKKVRKSKLLPPPAPVSKKKKTKKETTTVAPVPAPPIVTAKTKKSLIPPPSGGLIRGGSSTVAAAGRFGKRTNVASATTTTSTSTTSSKLKRKQKDISTAASTSAPAPPEPALYVPKQESTYGGLHPSRTHFYPFLESIPPEPSMKNRKQFSHLDKISMALNNFLTNGSNGETPLPDASIAKQAGLDMSSPIVQLLLETFEAISEKDKVAFGENKKQALVASLPELRATVDGLEPSKLLGDLYGMCGLLTRQYNFLRTSLKNMETWCQATFSDADYRQAYSLPEPFKPEKVGTIITSANRKWKKPVIPVRIVFAGYKEVKGTPVLLARLPAAVIHPDKKKKEETTKKKKKPAEKVATPTAPPAVPVPVTAKPPTAPKAYADCPPTERRQRILEKVAQLALALESQLNDRRTKRSSTPTTLSSSAAASNAASTKAVNDKAAATTVTATYIPQEEPPLHTARMWEWLDVAGFFHSTSTTDASSSVKHAGGLRLQSPEIFPRGLLLPTRSRILGRFEPVGIVADTPISSSSLYDRLQSLLVIEDDVDDKSKGRERDHLHDDDDDSDSDSEDEISLGFLDTDSDDDDDLEGMPRNHTREMADLSKLSTEERTFLHLCSAGLIKQSLFPMVELVLEDNDLEGPMEDDIVNVIGNMSTDLSTLTARNNARIRFLESAMDPMEVAYRKQLEEEQASVVAKCQSLLKRSKEKAKKSNKNRSSVSSAKDDLNLPW